MRLKDLVATEEDADISGIAFSSDNVNKGDLFFFLKGSTFDGHDFAAQAEKMGAAAVVCEREVSVSVPCVRVPDTRFAFAKAASAFYGDPAKKLKTFGITGTNGKTTTAYILAEILRQAGENVGLIGTNCVRYGTVYRAANLTTPDPIELYATLADMVNTGVTSVVMEVSAHALALRKTAGICYTVVGFTNLTQDHLDYFTDMETYACAKAKLFTAENAQRAVFNADDAFGRRLIGNCEIPFLSYGTQNPADVFGINLTMSAEGLRYVINAEDDIGEVKFALPGRFNMYNTLCAAAMAKAAGIGLKTILHGIKAVKRVDGRYNVINAADFSVIIDFAHTSDGLRNIITSVREFAPARLIVVFGCGGDRDKTKRPQMGEVAARYADFCIITSDNPRSEDPNAIITDVLQGVPPDRKAFVHSEPVRTEAIKQAFSMAERGDIVLIAGKGAENYQEIKGVKHAYNDEAFVMQLLADKKV
ncbi:MAG: UDP-N-acetylmuramoyl-L-alanyl-D-glutamate--2,6-diaminopimelate ligase [Clostridiales bacterium]|nr:UDP-N-acetylmuramoyl-L-alanyl-D-glutamate--2,6-diaminopimelate ligase [Clostridiales bacterium]